YDRLFEQYGYDAPAVGFGVDMGLLAAAIEHKAETKNANSVTDAGIDALREAADYRSKGQSINFGSNA
ncbi:MAG: hypothetical protein ACYTDT_04025, partial [Planctomycetota bacterium]